MFFHLYKYRFKQLFGQKSVILWTALFPFVLGTFFFLALYHISGSADRSFQAIPVAVYDTGKYQNEKEFQSFLKEMTDSDDTYFKVTNVTSKAKGEALVKEKKVKGFILVDEQVSLRVIESDFNTSILKEILDTYLRTQDLYIDAAKNHPQIMQQMQTILNQTKDYTKNKSFSGKNLNVMIGYFYALVAMSTLYGSIFSYINAVEIQPNETSLASRRLSSPTHRATMIIADYCAAITLQMLIFYALMFYLIQILGVDFEVNLLDLSLIGLAGAMFSSAWGYFVTIVFDFLKDGRMAINMAFSLVSSFLAGLMVGDIKPLLQEHAAWVTKINPATLISDAFYYIGIYNNQAEFYRCILTLFGMSLLLIALSYLKLRRKSYASA